MLVSAAKPGRINGQSVHCIHNLDAITSFAVDTSHLIPGVLNAERLINALSHTLSSYPVLTGRLHRGNGNKWEVVLNNAGVDLLFERADHLPPTTSVVQKPLHQLAGVNVAKLATCSDSTGEPLMRLRIIEYGDRQWTAISLSLWHTLGDGSFVLSFLRNLSRVYQGLSPLDPTPLYAEPPLSTEKLGSIDMPCHQRTYPIGRQSPSLNVEDALQPARIDFRLNNTQLLQLRSHIASRNAPAAGAMPLSRQDCLAALLALCFTLADPQSPIERVHTMLNTRGHPLPDNMAGNCIVWTSTSAKKIATINDIQGLATAIRRSILSGRDPKYVSSWNATAAPIYEAMANKSHTLDVAPPPRSIVINSSMRFDWTSANFGQPGTRFFHTSPPYSRYVKIFKANPEQMPDGTWLDRSNDVEVTLYVPKVARTGFQHHLAQSLVQMGVRGPVEWVNSI